MNTVRHGWTVRALAVSVAVLFASGGLAAATVEAGAPAGPRRVGAAGFVQEAVVDSAPTGRATAPVVVSTTVTATSPTPSTTAPRATATATTVRPPTSATIPGLPAPPLPTTTSPPVPPINQWSKTAGGITVRMHMEPAAPTAGQPVTFTVDVSAPTSCCMVHLGFGDEYGGPLTGGTGTGATGNTCGSPSGHTGLSITHTYAAPGVYPIFLMTVTYPCTPPAGSDGQPVSPATVETDIRACVAVGPSTGSSTPC